MTYGTDTYRAASGCGPFFVFVLVLGLTVGATLGLTSFIPNEAKNIYGVLAWVIMIGVGLIGTGIAIYIVHRMRRSAIARLAEMLRDDGFAVIDKPTAEQTQEVIAFLGPLVLFENVGRPLLEWYAVKGEGADRAIIAQHTLITGSGKTTRTHERSIVALPLPDPTGARPQVWFRRQAGQLYRIAGTDTAPDVEIGDAVLDKAFIIQCFPDASALRAAITDDVHRLIASGPKRESWTMARGHVCCIFGGTVKEPGLRAMMRRAQEMRRLWGRE